MIKWLEEGYKVRRRCWNEGDYVYLYKTTILNFKGDLVKFCNIKTLRADDWEIFKGEEYLLNEKFNKFIYRFKREIEDKMKILPYPDRAMIIKNLNNAIRKTKYCEMRRL